MVSAMVSCAVSGKPQARQVSMDFPFSHE